MPVAQRRSRPGRAVPEQICSCAAAGLDDPWAGATGKYSSWGGGNALGQTRHWLHIAVKGFWGLFVGVFIFWGLGVILLLYSIFFVRVIILYFPPDCSIW